MEKDKMLEEMLLNQTKPVSRHSWADREEDDTAPVFTSKMKEKNGKCVQSLKPKHAGFRESNSPAAGNINTDLKMDVAYPDSRHTKVENGSLYE